MSSRSLPILSLLMSSLGILLYLQNIPIAQASYSINNHPQLVHFPQSAIRGAYSITDDRPHTNPEDDTTYTDHGPNPKLERSDPVKYQISRGYHWSVPYAIEAMQFSFYRTKLDFINNFDNPPPIVPRIYDTATIYGNTPFGRHPGGAHTVGRDPNSGGDQGVNMDVGYYFMGINHTPYLDLRTNEWNTFHDADPAVCRDYKVDANGTPTEPVRVKNFPDIEVPKEYYHCLGYPQYLDGEIQAYQFVMLYRLDQKVYQATGEHLIRRIAVDGQILAALADGMNCLIRDGKLGVTQADKAAIVPTRSGQDGTLVYGEITDLGTGWYSHHYNHYHIRFNYATGKTAQEWASIIDSNLYAISGVKNNQTSSNDQTTDQGTLISLKADNTDSVESITTLSKIRTWSASVQGFLSRVFHGSSTSSLESRPAQINRLGY